MDETAKPVQDIWAQFTADPRLPQNARFRASDADRAHVGAVLAEAFADGRLDREEHAERLEKATVVKTLGQIPPLLNDLIAPTPVAWAGARAIERHETKGTATRRISGTTWSVLSVFFIAIWGITSLASGSLQYFWPIWPMIGMALPAVMMTLLAENTYERAGRPKRRPLARPVAPPMLGPAEPRNAADRDRAALKAAAREFGSELAAEARREAALRARLAAQRVREGRDRRGRR